MPGIFDALKIIKEQLPKFTQEMGVPFLGKDKPSSVMDSVNPNAEKHALESILEAAATMLPGAGVVGKATLRNPRLAGAGIAAATQDPTALINNPLLALATSSGDANAAFITPRAGATSLRKFLDSTLEHLPNPKITLPESGSTTLFDLYNKTPEGREILKATGIPNLKVVMREDMPPSKRGYVTPDSININAFPFGNEFSPEKTVYHEVQHVIDEVQKRTSGTNLKDADRFSQDLKVSDTLAKTDKSGTIAKQDLDEIWNQAQESTYARQVGENRARIDAEQYPQFSNEETWMVDPLTQMFTSGR